MFAKQIGKSFLPVRVQWGALFVPAKSDPKNLELLSNGTCDFYAVSLTATEERSQFLNIAPLYPGRTLVVVRKGDQKNFKSVKDLFGKTTAVVKGTTYYDWLINENNKRIGDKITIIELPKGGSSQKLLNKEVDFILADTIQAFYLMKKYPKEIGFAFPAGENESIGWGFRKSDQMLKNKFVEFIKSEKTRTDSELNKIFVKYFGVNINTFESIVFSSVQDI